MVSQVKAIAAEAARRCIFDSFPGPVLVQNIACMNAFIGLLTL